MKRRDFLALMGVAGASGLIGCSQGGSTSAASSSEAATSAASSAAASSSAAADGSEMVAGSYTATVQSIGGPMTVEVSIGDNAIEGISVLETHDTDGIISNVIEQITDEVANHQSINVDTVSGATMSSTYLRNAIKDAVSQGVSNIDALGDPAEYVAEPQKDLDVDVVVVGGGIAGIATAAMASEKGLSVALVEKNGFIGGNALISEAGLLGSQTEPIESRFDDMLEIIQGYGASFTRSPRDDFPIPVYYFDEVGDESAMGHFIGILIDKALDNGADLLTNNEALELVVENDAVTGVVAQPKGQDPYTIHAKAVVLCTGGFSANNDLVAQYMPQYDGISHGGLAGSTGDALAWVEPLDAKTIMLDSDAQFYNNNPVTGSRGTIGSYYPLYVDTNGDAFTESAYYTDAAHAAWETFGSDTYYGIIAEAEVETSGTQWWIEHMLEAQDTFKFSSIADIAKECDLPGLEKAAEDYGLEPEGTYYVSPCEATIYATYGGIGIDEEAHVVDNKDEPIPGLYACGEVIGSPNYQQNGMYVGQLGPSLAMAMIASETIAASI